MKVLVISSSEADTRWIKNILFENSVEEIKSCTNSTDAVELLAEGDFSFVLTEIFLPVLSGFDLKKLMDSFGYAMPVVFFSEKVSESTIKEAGYAGVKTVFSLDGMDQELPAFIEEMSVRA